MSRTLSTKTYLALILGLLFVILSVVVVVVVNMTMRRLAFTDAEQDARMLLDHNLAIHTYFSQDLKPKLFEQIGPTTSKDYFEPVWMSSTYAIRKIDGYFHHFNPSPYYYKECAINARSPENEADAYEKAFLVDLQHSPQLTTKSAIRVLDGKPYFTLLRRGEAMEESCLRCHSSPEQAPGDLVRHYGPERSFHRKVKDVVQAISIRIPVSEAFSSATRVSYYLSGLLLLVLGGGFLFVWVGNKRLLIDPMAKIQEQALQLASQPKHLGETIPKPKVKELDDLVASFNKMSVALRKTYDELEQRVLERTKELNDANQELEEEIEDRKKAEEALRHSEERYRSLFDNMNNAVAVYTAEQDGEDFIFVDFNAAGEKIDNIDKKEVIGQSVLKMFPGVKEFGLFEVFQRVWRTGEPEYHPVALYRDERIQGWRDNFVYKLSTGEMVVVYRDETERKMAEKALRESEQKFRIIFDQAPLGIALVGLDYRLLSANKAYCDLLGYSEEELSQLRFGDFTHPDDLAENLRLQGELGSGRVSSYQMEKRFIRKDGETAVGLLVASLLSNDAGVSQYFVGLVLDITDRKKAEQALLASEARYRRLFEAAKDGILILDSETGQIVDVNPFMSGLLGYSREEMLQKKLWEIGLFADIAKSQTVFAELQSKEYVRYEDLSLQTIGGEVINVEFVSNVYLVNGAKVIQCNIRDITERRLAEEALVSEKKRFEALAESSPFGIAMIRQDGSFEYANPKFSEMFGYDLSEIRTGRDWFRNAFPDPDYRHEVIAAWFEDLENATPDQLRPRIFKVTCKDGILKVIHFRPVLLPSGEHVVTYEDITQSMRAEEALRQSEEKYRTLFEDSLDALFITAVDGTLVDANQAFFDLLGGEKEERLGQSVLQLYADQADRPSYLEALAAKGFVRDYPLRLVRKDGRQIDCLISSRVERDKDGNILSSMGFIRDITEQKSVQKQLLQAQKMEAIGTLSGGIAHDFNNLLTVVMGFSELLLAEKKPKDWEYADLQKIFQAAKSGGDLVQRLLMFSRKSEPKPVPMDLNKQIVQVEKMLRRTIPKMIEVRLDLSSDLPRINADPPQVEQVIMNLAVNARDAMPDKGKLTLRTNIVTLDEEYCRLNVEARPGEYVLLEISDTGRGLDKETAARIFEPFFTTKETGKGTGLGLAMVFGIVKQHNGHINVYSEVGKGTTFRVYLPAIEGEVETDVETTSIMPAFGTETVLLVDDEEFVRELGARILTKHGYTVLQAVNGREALDLFKKERSQISLVILDLIMPEMGGTECLKELLKVDPQVKVLIASGYSADTSVKESIQMGAKGFVTKPFRVKELLRDVRRVLDES
jgi:two-component system, cell cycle sensor histidine kinase and response regulator CckA